MRYSGRFKGYNANGRRYGSRFVFNLSKNWRRVDKSIQIGLIQELMGRLLKWKFKTATTMNMELYHHFLRGVHISIPKTKVDPLLVECFVALNDQYFNGLLEVSNLCWGQKSYRKLGSYEFGTDTITISKALHPSVASNAKFPKLLEYVLYHEMLHKKHKFNSANGRSCSHTREFRDDEARFKDASLCENRLKHLQPSGAQSARSGTSSVRSRFSQHPFGKLINAVWR